MSNLVTRQRTPKEARPQVRHRDPRSGVSVSRPRRTAPVCRRCTVGKAGKFADEGDATGGSLRARPETEQAIGASTIRKRQRLASRRTRIFKSEQEGQVDIGLPCQRPGGGLDHNAIAERVEGGLRSNRV